MPPQCQCPRSSGKQHRGGQKTLTFVQEPRRGHLFLHVPPCLPKAEPNGSRRFTGWLGRQGSVGLNLMGFVGAPGSTAPSRIQNNRGWASSPSR